MSLIKCPKCGEMFSDSYKTCPFCEEDEAYYSGKVRKHKGRRAAESRRRKAPSVLGPVAVIVLILLAALVVWLIFGDQIKEAITGEKPPITDVDKPDDTIDKPDDTPVTPTISLNRTVLVLNVGEKDELKVNGTEDTVEWSSSAPTVASVNSAGEVTALTKGNAVITAEVNGESVTCTVTVRDESDAPDNGTDTPDNNSTTTKPNNSNKPSTGTTKVDVSKLKLKLTMGEWVSTIESPNSDGNFEITSVQGEEWTLAVDGTTAAVIWSAESGNSVATVSGDTLKVTGSSTGRYTTITGKVGDATIKLIVRIR
ncbi:MAG: Ig-like domain-containing protein [Oscillospiraceae bacterium]